MHTFLTFTVALGNKCFSQPLRKLVCVAELVRFHVTELNFLGTLLR